MKTALSTTSTSRLLSRILDEPRLAEQVQALPPRALSRLIERVGLEDAGEIVALATTEQLARVFDDDLWQSERIGEDERFDDQRFLLWLAVMREAGDRFVATKLTELSEELVTMAFHRQILVLGLDALASDLGEGGDEADAIEKALSSCLSEEIDEYFVVSRGHDGFDDVFAALVALDEVDHDLAVRILEHCRRMDADAVDREGLYDVISAAETLETDVAAERQTRRAELGFVAPSDATAFMKLARSEQPIASKEHDPLTRAYLRELTRAPLSPTPSRTASAVLGEPLAALVAEDEVAPRTAGLLPAGGAERLLPQALRQLADANPRAFAARSDELAFLANMLVAGASVEGRRLRPVEAIGLAMATVSLGLEMAAGKRPGKEDRAVRILGEHVATALFLQAWRRLEDEVRGPAVAQKKVAAIEDIEPLEALADPCPHLRAPLVKERGELHWFGSLAEVTRAVEFLERQAARNRSSKRRRA